MYQKISEFKTLKKNYKQCLTRNKKYLNDFEKVDVRARCVSFVFP